MVRPVRLDDPELRIRELPAVPRDNLGDRRPLRAEPVLQSAAATEKALTVTQLA
jgi:hypothetical protein